MTLAIDALIGGALLWVWPDIVRRGYASATREDERLRATTDDGLSLALYRYTPRGGTRRAHPVLLVHGLASSRHSWDLGTGPSFAMHLASLGYDTFVVELRGHEPGAGTSILGGPCATRTFDSHLLFDVPAAVRAVREATRCEQLHYVGHSMGGLLGYALMSTARADFMRTCTVIGSSLDYSTSDSDLHVIGKLLPASFLIPGIPFGTLGTASAPFALTVSSPFDRFNVWPSNIAADVYRRLLAIGFVDEPTSLLVSLASSITGGGLVGDDGTRYGDPAALARATVPHLALAGDRDRQCPFSAAHATFDLLGSPDKTLAKLGPDHDCADHYGHIDLVSGLRAPAETWPLMTAFFATHD